MRLLVHGPLRLRGPPCLFDRLQFYLPPERKMAEPILIAQHVVSAKETTECFLLPALANRHGLITGATGTGKTIAL